MSVRVVALIRAKKGKEKPLEDILKVMVKTTHTEAGCQLYALHKSESAPGTFVFVEKWATPQELEAHLSAPHIGAAMARKDELIESIEIMPLVPLPAGKTTMETF